MTDFSKALAKLNAAEARIDERIGTIFDSLIPDDLPPQSAREHPQDANVKSRDGKSDVLTMDKIRDAANLLDSADDIVTPEKMYVPDIEKFKDSVAKKHDQFSDNVTAFFGVPIRVSGAVPDGAVAIQFSDGTMKMVQL